MELLKVLRTELNLGQKDLVPIFKKTESIVSEMLSGHRKLTISHIQKLANFFQISPAAFLKLHSSKLQASILSFYAIYC
ncbi:helix-turn-helix domain-containing protein [Leptothermofonsia sp. ETS-13]|uniref:helix-turn-helix domain-containing protein n=1 Tax=Leptothermofonsia sp. ETS-13 TaxID=3035696 RepID=UPI003BA17F58